MDLSRLIAICLTLPLMLVATLAAAEPAKPPLIDKPLLAYWTFDEATPAEYRESSGARNWSVASSVSAMTGMQSITGVYGQAVRFSEHHSFQVRTAAPLGEMPAISFSVWVLPENLAGYREIFRMEGGDRRLLFSFQENGAIIALGLNVAGYVECDAQVAPKNLADGGWHHCVGTFDGQTMRVYVDGAEIGRIDRPGQIAAPATQAACIGSLDGGEAFQGLMDDLRVYRAALTADDVATLYRQGREQVELANKIMAQHWAKMYVKREDMAATLAGALQYLTDQSLKLTAGQVAQLQSRLKTDFPDDYERFAPSWESEAHVLLNGDRAAMTRILQRTTDLLVEYRPLTENQWARQSAEARKRWNELDRLAEKLRQHAAGDQPPASADWIRTLVQAWRHIALRPYQQEPVAPYVRPETPPVVQLTADDARKKLQEDWLFQADNQPTPKRIRDEIRWTRQLAARLATAEGGPLDLSAELAELEELEHQAAALTSPQADLYFRVRELKRRITLRNPALKFDRIVLVDMPFPQGGEWRHETRHRLGYQAVPGARLLVLQGLAPDGQVRQLMPQTPLHGAFWRPDVSFDGQKVLFCFKPHNEKSFHLYEIGADGSGFKQLTDGPFDDLDPIYLPDGHILFSTTRAHTYVRCMPPTNAFVLARCDADGRNVFLVSANNEPDYLPSMMHDGRVIYTRWEYTDKPLWRAQKLWTINPDGTQVSTYWGNQSVWPDLMKDARAIPGTRRVMFTGCGHHDWFAGSVGIINPDHGYNFPNGLTKVTAEVPWPEVGNGPTDPIESPEYHRSGSYAAYYSPYPISERDFLVSAERNGRFALYLMDLEGNRELIYEGTHHILHAMPLAARPRPPLVADRVAWPTPAEHEHPKQGVIFSSNVYQNAPAELRDKAKFLRVMSIDPKTYTYWSKRPYISTGPVVSVVQSEGVKRVLGTVPIEKDGSVSFQAPPGTPLHFQLLDENQLALQTMRSFVGVMPGENRGCLGCHESHSRAPVVDAGLATRRAPRSITPPPWKDDTVSYPRYVRPVLDAYCSKCHEGDGEGRKAVDLTARPGFLGFDESYALFTGHPTWAAQYQIPANPPLGLGIAGMLMVEAYTTVDPMAYRTPPPMTKLSYRSRLVELCGSGQHYGVKVDPINLQRIAVWVDAMCPYRGDEEVRAEDDPVFQGVDWLAIRPRIKTAPRIVRPGPVDER